MPSKRSKTLRGGKWYNPMTWFGEEPAAIPPPMPTAQTTPATPSTPSSTFGGKKRRNKKTARRTRRRVTH